MLKKIAPLFFILILIGCGDVSKTNMERLQISNEDEVNVPLVIIDVPKAIGKSNLSKTVNKKIREKIIDQLVFEEANEIVSLNDAVLSFKKSFLDIRDKFPEEVGLRWEAKVVGEVLYETKDIITVRLESYNFTGGAHGYESTMFLNFDKNKGKLLKNEDLILDNLDFVAFAEKKFRIQEKVSLKANINDTGFMFREEEFQLPENIGYTEEGLQLLYNVYEIASYTDGQIILVLPYKEVNAFLRIKGQK